MTLTIKRAAELARPLGYTIRRTDDSELVGYKKGAGVESPAAYFSDCPLDVLATVANMAAQDGAPQDALDAAAAACGVQITRTQPEARESFIIDATPMWASLAPAFVMALQNGTPEGQQIAREEMARGFAALDAHNARARAIADSLETARLFLAAFPEAPETLTRAELARRFVDARETLAAIVDAAQSPDPEN